MAFVLSCEALEILTYLNIFITKLIYFPDIAMIIL